MTRLSISKPPHWTIVAGAFLAALLANPSGAQAFDGLMSLCLAGLQRVTPDNLWSAWSLAPEIVAPLAIFLVGYRYGCRYAPCSGPRRTAFIAGWTVLVIALVSPLCRLSPSLVSAHMVQHMLLITAAPILLALSRPGPALRASMARLAGGRDGLPLLPMPGLSGLTVALGAAIWLWHTPAIYTLLLTNAAVHLLGTSALIVIATMFWSAVLVDGYRRIPAAVVALLATMVHTGLLGALLTFASRPLYPVGATSALDWGLAPIEDQQLAGLIMWVPGGIVFMAAALAVCGLWLRGPARVGTGHQSRERSVV